MKFQGNSKKLRSNPKNEALRKRLSFLEDRLAKCVHDSFLSTHYGSQQAGYFCLTGCRFRQERHQWTSAEETARETRSEDEKVALSPRQEIVAIGIQSPRIASIIKSVAEASCLKTDVLRERIRNTSRSVTAVSVTREKLQERLRRHAFREYARMDDPMALVRNITANAMAADQ